MLIQCYNTAWTLSRLSTSFMLELRIMKRIYITTAIPYVNAAPHVGFALEAVQADSLARFYRALGYDVYFASGTDENSLKNVQAAEAEGIPTQELVDKYAKQFENLKDALN